MLFFFFKIFIAHISGTHDLSQLSKEYLQELLQINEVIAAMASNQSFKDDTVNEHMVYKNGMWWVLPFFNQTTHLKTLG